MSNEELIALALGELREARARGARGQGSCGRRGPREARDVFGGARAAAAPGTATRCPGLLLAGDWIDTGLPATIESAAISGRRAAEADLMNSIVVHYQEIALKGKNRPWFLGRLVRNLRPPRATSTCNAGAHADGPHRDRARPGSAWEPVAERLRHVFGIANFSRAGARAARPRRHRRRRSSTTSAIARVHASACRRAAPTSAFR